MKKRYQVTLTEETVNRFQALAGRLKMPKGIMSTVLDDALVNILESMEKFETAAKGKGQVTIGDLFKVIGEQMDKITEEKHEEEQPKKKKARKPDMDGVYRR